VFDLRDAAPLDGKYRIEALLGEGGMGAVYRATHVGTTRTVAVKVIHPEWSAEADFVTQFQREAEAAGRLRHPNVVDVTDFGVAETRSGRVAYLVMEFLDGRSLGGVLRDEGRLSIDAVVDIIEQAASALSEAHQQGIVHRDIKPENIWLEPNRRGGYTVKVLDFGLATVGGGRAPVFTRTAALGAEDDTRVVDEPTATVATPASTLTGSITGTPRYMSPEQCRGERLDARSDIYSLGLVTYRMLAGETPFNGSVDELLAQHQHAAPADIRDREPHVSRRVASVVMSTLAKHPADRPSTAAGFASALRAAAEGSGALLRQAVALYSLHFPAFFKLSLLMHLPVVALVAILLALGLGEQSREGILEGIASAGSESTAWLILASVVMTSIVSFLVTSAASAPLVMQVIATPLKRVRVQTGLDVLRRRWFVVAATAVLDLLLVVTGAFALVVPGLVIGVWLTLLPPVAAIEHQGVFATLSRVFRLTRRVWTTALVVALVQFTLPVLVWIAAVDTSFVFRLDEHWQPSELGFGFEMSAESLPFQLLNIPVTPLASIMTALLYLKARGAGGETLDASRPPSS